MRFLATRYVKRYRKSVEELFGWTPDDLMQHIRIAVWKGLATFDPKRGIKVETYLSTIINNFFNSLAKRCGGAARHRPVMLTDLHDEYEGCAFLQEQLFHKQHATPQGVEPVDEHASRAEWSEYFIGKLTALEAQVGRYHFIEGVSLQSLADEMHLTRQALNDAAQSFKHKLLQHVREEEDDGDET